MEDTFAELAQRREDETRADAEDLQYIYANRIRELEDMTDAHPEEIRQLEAQIEGIEHEHVEQLRALHRRHVENEELFQHEYDQLKA